MKKNIWLIVGAIVLISIIFNVVGDSFASLLLIVGAILVNVGIRGRKVPAADPQVLPSLTREREAHYFIPCH